MLRGPRRKRSPTDPPPEASQAILALAGATRSADRAKEALLAAVPHGRGPGAPVAESLAAFEEHLALARRSLAEWPPATAEPERRAASAAIDESLRRAEGLRLNASPEGYDQLYALLGEALDPLDALGDVAERLEEMS